MRPPTEEDRFEDLPVLEELRVSLAQAYAREEALTAPAAEPSASRRRWRWPRRLLILAGATAVLVPSAVATKPWWAEAPDTIDPSFPLESRKPVILGEGSGPQEAWQITASVRRGERCLALNVSGGSESVSCDATVPQRRDLSISFGSGRRDGFVYGASSTQVVEVRVRTATGEEAVARTQAPDADTLGKGGVPRDFRWFVVVLPEPIDPTQQPSIVGYDAQGKAVDSFRPRAG